MLLKHWFTDGCSDYVYDSRCRHGHFIISGNTIYDIPSFPFGSLRTQDKTLFAVQGRFAATAVSSGANGLYLDGVATTKSIRVLLWKNNGGPIGIQSGTGRTVTVTRYSSATCCSLQCQIL